MVPFFSWLLHEMGKNKCYPLFKRYFDELFVLSTYQILNLSGDLFRGWWRQAVTGDHLEPPLDWRQVCPRVDLKERQIQSTASRCAPNTLSGIQASILKASISLSFKLNKILSQQRLSRTTFGAKFWVDTFPCKSHISQVSTRAVSAVNLDLEPIEIRKFLLQMSQILCLRFSRDKTVPVDGCLTLQQEMRLKSFKKYIC